MDTTTIVTASLRPSSDGRIEGWNQQPDSRGTIDIISTCLATTFLCTYTILSLNCPSRHEGEWKTQARKLLWVGIGIAGPEFVLTAAAGQLAAARHSVAAFRAAGVRGWTYRHAFFANMGGFELVPPDFPPFRINSRHIRWLVGRKYIAVPEVPDEELWDKSKRDTVAKIITCLQAGYLILQCVGRAVQRLHITTLELSTVAIVVCSIMTSICWLRKPQDVRSPVRIEMATPMAQVLSDAGPVATHPYRQTPLDFVDDFTPSWALNVHPFMGLPVGGSSAARPITRVGDSRLPWLSWNESSYLFLATLLYSFVHMIGWNFSFPTRLEQILWRVSSSILVGTTVVFWLVESLAQAHRTGYLRKIVLRVFRMRAVESSPDSKVEAPKTSLPDRDTTVGEDAFIPIELPLKWEFWGIFPLALVYALARGYILVEAFLGLRSLPVSAYLSVQWLSLLPHI
jgi:hypothetical protein